MTHTIALQSLSEREAVADALYRMLTSFDTADGALFDSAFTSDAVFDINGSITSGLSAVHAEGFDKLAKLDTTHMASCVRVDVKGGESKASMTATLMAQHYRPGQGMQPNAPRLLMGALMAFDLIRDDENGLWKITYWKHNVVWSEGDREVLTDEGVVGGPWDQDAHFTRADGNKQ